ncbi:hypothetical protein ZTR_00497 [Talaromyces verruculosus]|nr:hypothetical protein ZTR_00497 [Talaromyces verruculosus]
MYTGTSTSFFFFFFHESAPHTPENCDCSDSSLFFVVVSVFVFRSVVPAFILSAMAISPSLFRILVVSFVALGSTSYGYSSNIISTKGLAISVSGLFVATITFPEVAPTAFANIGWKYYTVFIACTTLSFLFVWLYCPGTSQKSLESIPESFGVSVEPANVKPISDVKKTEERDS